MSSAVLFVRTGVIDSTPPGYNESLQNQYTGEFFSPWQLAKEARQVVRAKDVARHAYSQALALALNALRCNRNVVLGSYINKRSHRENIREAVQQIAGARVVLISTEPTPLTVVEQRLQTARDANFEPLNETAIVQRRAAARFMLETVQYPDDAEPHLPIDGSQDKVSILRAVHEYVCATEPPAWIDR